VICPFLRDQLTSCMACLLARCRRGAIERVFHCTIRALPRQRSTLRKLLLSKRSKISSTEFSTSSYSASAKMNWDRETMTAPWEEPKCTACKKRKSELETSLKYCAKCKEAEYCSRECQKDDWKRHKQFCAGKSQIDWFVPPAEPSLPQADHPRQLP
jgi:hypothetical protein